MKTLKKENEFKRLPDSTSNDRKRIDDMINDGWIFVPKKEWKETRPVKKEKTKKRGKNH